MEIQHYHKNYAIILLNQPTAIAEDIKSAKNKIKNKEIFIAKKMHIDGIQEIVNVDGYSISVTKKELETNNPIFNYDAVKNLD